MYESLYCRLFSITTCDMSKKIHIVHTSNRKTVRHKYKRRKKMGNIRKEVQTKLTKGLLELIVLQFIDSQPMHGYQIITKIRRSFGVYFGPSTVYPLLNSLEKKGHLTSRWDMKSERPRKIYELTNEGKNLLNFTENSLNLLFKTIVRDTTATVELSGTEKSRETISYQKRIIPPPGAPIR
jgi:DNA-binding PadR family transcriptional regulator